MKSFMISSALATFALALTASAAPQCNTDADCISGFICGPSDFEFTQNNDKVCVQLHSCSNQVDPQFPKEGPKCGDSIFCNPGGYCGAGYYEMNGDRFLTEVCVDQATGVKCAST